MSHFLPPLPTTQLPQQAPTPPELPPGPSLDRVRAPIEIPLLELWQIVLIALLGIVVVGLLGWKLVQNIRKQKHPAPISPQDAAIAELRSAAETTADDDARFARLSSLALRRYFESGKGIAALGQTTEEFLKRLNEHILCDADSRKSLAAFMQHCDRVKFAKAPLTKAERRGLTESALKIVQQCEATQPETNTTDPQS